MLPAENYIVSTSKGNRKPGKITHRFPQRAKKLNVDFKGCKILGACNPPFAYEALKLEDKIGTMLPCNVIVQEQADGMVEVSTVDPMASMGAVGNPALTVIAEQVQVKLKKVIESL